MKKKLNEKKEKNQNENEKTKKNDRKNTRKRSVKIPEPSINRKGASWPGPSIRVRRAGGTSLFGDLRAK